jgi:outer membrane protein TolC
MTKKTILALLVLALAAAGPGLARQAQPAQPAQQAQSTMSISLDECITRALRDNLGVAMQVLNPEISAEALNQAEAKFVPTLSFSVRAANTENASYSYLDSAESLIDKTQNFTFLNATQPLPTGGTFSLDFSGSKTSSNRTGQTINPRYSTTLRFNFTQPLLKNFGNKMSRREILVAKNNLGVSDETLRKTLQDTVYNVESAYWNLVYSIENLDVRRQSLQLAKDLLEKNQRSVEVGTLAPMEVLSAQAEVATREADLIQAETQIKNNEDQLKLLLRFTSAEDQAVTAILPKDKPTYTLREVSLDEALAAAIENRTDLEISRIGLETEKINLSYAKNQVLPDLSLSASYYSPGIDGTRLFFTNNDPIYGTVIPGLTQYGDISGAMKQTARFQYPNWNLGLTLSLPLANVFSRASLAQAKLNMRQALLDIENQKAQAYVEVKTSVRTVEANYKRILAYTTARQLAEQKLAAEEEKRRVGMSTNYMVLSYQRDLANARISELNAIVSYNVSQAALERSMGTNLISKNIQFSDFLTGSR